MKKNTPDELSLMQYIFMVNGAQVGIGSILSLPSRLAKTAGTDGWISLPIGWAIAVVASTLMILAMKKHPEDTLYDLISRYFGKVLGGILNIGVILYYAFVFYVCFFSTIALVKLQILSLTPALLVVLLFLVPTYTITSGRIRVLSRYAELTFWLSICLFIAYLKPLSQAQIINILPVLKDGWQPVLNTVQTACVSFLGFETAFVLYPYLRNKKGALKGMILGNTLTLSMYLLVTFGCFLFFSPDDMASYRFPTIRINKAIEFRFLNRIDVIFLSVFLFTLAKGWMSYLFCAVFGTSRLLGGQDPRPYLIAVLASVLLLTFFYMPTDAEIDKFLKILGTMGQYFAFAFPLILLVFVNLFSRFAKET